MGREESVPSSAPDCHSPPPCVIHIPTISSSLIWLPEWYLVKSTNREAPDYVIISNHNSRSFSSSIFFNTFFHSGWATRVWFPAGQDFSLLHNVHTGSWTHPASYPVWTAFLSSCVKRPGRAANHSAPSNAEVNAYSYTCTPLHVCMSCACLCTRCNFTFTLSVYFPQMRDQVSHPFVIFQVKL
jgi:hypothetical protein